MPSAVYLALRSAITEFCRPGRTSRRLCAGASRQIPREDYCFDASDPATLATYPGVRFTLANNVAVTLPPAQLFVNMGWGR